MKRDKVQQIPNTYAILQFSLNFLSRSNDDVIIIQVTKIGVVKIESTTVTKVTEYFWQYTVKWELVAFVGVDEDKAIVLKVFIFTLFTCCYFVWFSHTTEV